MRTMSIVRIAACAAIALPLGIDSAHAGQSSGLAPAVGLAAGGAQPAQGPDPRWVPWLGCWQLLQDSQRSEDDADPGFDAGALEQGRARPPRASGSVQSVQDLSVCVTPDGADGVTMTTRSGGVTLFEDTVFADGARRALTDAECRGSQRAEWSLDGDRLFAEAEIACGAQPVRTVSGLTMMAAGGTWLDIQAVEIEGYESVRVRRYRRAADQSPAGLAPGLLERAERTTYLSGGRPFTIQDVIEASGKVSSQAVEVALIETQARFDLDRDTLVLLDDSGVDESLVDLMVALSYPDRFEYDRRASAPAVSYRGRTYGSFGYDPLWYGLDGYGPYDYYYYTPFGYRGWGYYYGYSPYYYQYSARPLYVPSRPRASDRSSGRVVNDRGYTRVRPRGSSGGDANTGGRRQTGSRNSGSGGSSGGSSSGGSSSGGTVTPQGATGGGSGGRTAVPR